MNGGYPEILLRAVDEVVEAVRAFNLPALVEAEVQRQLNEDEPSKPVAPPKRDSGNPSGLRIVLHACGLSAAARMRLAVDAMLTINEAAQERIADLVQSEILRQRPVSEQAQREFDEWSAIRRAQAARRAVVAALEIRGRRLQGKLGVA